MGILLYSIVSLPRPLLTGGNDAKTPRAIFADSKRYGFFAPAGKCARWQSRVERRSEKGIDTETGEDRSGGGYHFGVASGKFGAPLNRISDVEPHTIYRSSFAREWCIDVTYCWVVANATYPSYSIASSEVDGGEKFLSFLSSCLVSGVGGLRLGSFPNSALDCPLMADMSLCCISVRVDEDLPGSVVLRAVHVPLRGVSLFPTILFFGHFR